MPLHVFLRGRRRQVDSGLVPWWNRYPGKRDIFFKKNSRIQVTNSGPCSAARTRNARGWRVSAYPLLRARGQPHRDIAMGEITYNVVINVQHFSGRFILFLWPLGRDPKGRLIDFYLVKEFESGACGTSYRTSPMHFHSFIVCLLEILSQFVRKYSIVYNLL